MADDKLPKTPARLTDNLDENSTDMAVKIIRGLLGIATYIGSTAAELVDSIIPKQREDRIVDFLRNLAVKVENQEEFIQKMKTPEGVDLTQEALIQAAR